MGIDLLGQPQLITRFYAVKDSRTLGITMVVVCLFTVLTSSGYHLNGLIARAMYGNRVYGGSGYGNSHDRC